MRHKTVIKKSLSKKFVSLMGIFILSFIIGATLLLISLNFLNETYISKRDELRDKQHLTEEINTTFNQAFFDARGYFAYGNKSLKNNALAQESIIKGLSQKFEKLAVSEEDLKLLGRIDEFNQFYFHEILPHVITEYEAGHTAEVERIANNQAIQDVAQFQDSMEVYLDRLDHNLEMHYKKLTNMQTKIQIVFVLFILFILLLLLRIIRLMLRQIGQPLSNLALAAEEIANGSDKMIQINHNREDEIGALSIAFQTMVEKVKDKEKELRARNEELNILLQLKSELVSTVSHELRTPLASILGFTELMLHRELRPERVEKYLTTIYNEAKRLTALINDFLDIQKMEAGKQSYEKKYIELIPILEKVIESQQVNTTLHEIYIEPFISDSTILGDKEKLEQVFTNLINNAIKYSPDGGKIKVQVSQNDKELKVAIIDNGLGIPNDAIDKLFTKFYRVDNSDRRKIGGTGLGLAIVQEIVKAHEGKITVQSDFGMGSTFTAIFPAVQINQVVLESSQTNDVNTGFRILVIEDDQNLAELISQELWDSGFVVIWLKNSVDVFDYLNREIPDAIVLDILLDDQKYDGWQIMREMKQKEKLKNIPIIVSTALDEKEKGYQLGAKDFLIKPYKPSHLSKAIMQTLLKVGKVGQILIPEKDE